MPCSLLQFLSDHPQLLTREGAPEIRAKLRLFASWRLPPPMCPLLLARCPRLLRESDEQLQVGFGGLAELTIRWPSVGLPSDAPLHVPATSGSAARATSLVSNYRKLDCKLQKLQAVVDIFLGYGFTWPNVHAVLLGYAPVLRVE